jgi:hypothetical protein
MTNLEIASEKFKAYDAATIEHLFRNGPAVDDAAFGYRHGWMTVNGQSFNREMVTGEQYDITQGGWAWL